MADDTSESAAYPEQVELCRALAAALPIDRAALILRFLECHSGDTLHLRGCDGQPAMLDGINFSPDYLLTEVQKTATPPVWWNTGRKAIDFRKIDLRGASLRKANFQNAILEMADFAGADLDGSDFSGADLQGALFEDAKLHNAVFRFARGRESIWEEAVLVGADFWGADMERSDLSGAEIQRATFEEANFVGADLAGTDFRGSNLKRCNLKGANFQGADLRDTALGATNLEDVVLRDANIQELDFTHCVITHIHTCGARMERTRLDQEQLGGCIGEELAGEFGAARKGYLALERNFEELGDHDGASWAYRRRRRMEKKHAGREGRIAWSHGRWALSGRFFLKFTVDQLVELICDYGESVFRVLGTLLFIYFLFIPIYGLTGTVVRVENVEGQVVKTPTYEMVDLALFSLASMTTPGNPPDYLRPKNELAYLFAGIQSLLSIFLTGLMGFVAGNRIRR